MTELRNLNIVSPVDSTTGGVEVSMQDQYTPTIDSYMLKSLQSPVNPDSAISDGDIVLDILTASLGSITTGSRLFVAEAGLDSFWQPIVKGLNADTPVVGTTRLDLDVPAPIDMTTSANVFLVEDDLSNHFTTPDHPTIASPDSFKANNNDVVAYDITRIILQIQTSTAPELSDFGDIAGGLASAVDEGPIVLRHWVNAQGHFHNIARWYNNLDLMGWMFDLDLISGFGASGDKGLKGRMTFGGSSKHGVVIRLEQNDYLEALIQDDLSDLTSFKIMVQGHRISD
jgi:hypothetical protein